jgi:peptidoglycan DL-endopeptidase CwlO
MAADLRLWRTPPCSRSMVRRGGTWILTGAVVVATFVAAGASPRPAGASKLTDARSKAARLYSEVQSMNAQVGALGQRYDAAQIRLSSLNALITHSEVAVRQAQQAVRSDQETLRQAAVNAYINANYSAATNPLFNTRASTIGAAKVYNQIAEGNIQTSVSSLKVSTIQLTTQRQVLSSQRADASAVAADAAAALRKAQGLQAKMQNLLNAARGQVAYYLRQAEAAAAAAAAAQYQNAMGKNHGHWPVPPLNTQAGRAVAFALSMLGVPYVWGGASRRGVDCSGLTMLAWEAAGVGLPHYSGAQFSSTVYVPAYAMKPGDLLFYGRYGSEHVAMYIGRGMMIEAPTFGQRVHITPVRMGYNFSGVRRPR